MSSDNTSNAMEGPFYFTVPFKLFFVLWGQQTDFYNVPFAASNGFLKVRFT